MGSRFLWIENPKAEEVLFSLSLRLEGEAVKPFRGKEAAWEHSCVVLRPSVCLHVVCGWWKCTPGHKNSPINTLTHILPPTQAPNKTQGNIIMYTSCSLTQQVGRRSNTSSSPHTSSHITHKPQPPQLSLF